MDMYLGQVVKVSVMVPYFEGGGMTGRVIGWTETSVDIDFDDGEEGWVEREYVFPADEE